MPSFAPVNEQLDEIRRDAVEIIPEDDLVRKLERSARSGEALRIKQGFDPTRPDLHIGHAVSMRKLHTFQELGHQVIFVVGDYTARVGDPSGRSETRPRLTPAEIEANAATYAHQVERILDVGKVRVEFNSRWLAPLDLARLLELTATYTVARMLERDDFAKRYGEQRPIAVSEFLYPLMQAYDSVALEADVELGGTDQKFNLLVGRTVQERYGQEPQVCLIMPLLRGTDGETKMSKSYDNYIGITEPATEQYGKTMSAPDTLLEEWIRLALPLTPAELAAALQLAAAEPYRAKRQLAHRIVALYHGPDEADRAATHFDRLFRDHAPPEQVDERRLSLGDERLRVQERGGVWLPGLLVAAGLAASNAEAARLIEQGAVAVDEVRVGDRNAVIPVSPGDARLIRRGKRQFARVLFER
ncbi:MAG TPA: tyrosine--tRNA ligase [Longimicrobiales bacterium]|nr:tyrosine--tRNA ligase [Longimicrobiales bacterium]